MFLNKAFETLKRPLLRAKYLLGRRAGIHEDDAETLDDPEFLMSVMDIRQSIDECSSEKELEPYIIDNQRDFALFPSRFYY